MFGPAAADRFLDTYLGVADGFTYNSYWDLDAILEMCIPQTIRGDIARRSCASPIVQAYKSAVLLQEPGIPTTGRNGSMT
jgi:hypothetical protein